MMIAMASLIWASGVIANQQPARIEFGRFSVPNISYLTPGQHLKIVGLVEADVFREMMRISGYYGADKLIALPDGWIPYDSSVTSEPALFANMIKVIQGNPIFLDEAAGIFYVYITDALALKPIGYQAVMFTLSDDTALKRAEEQTYLAAIVISRETTFGAISQMTADEITLLDAGNLRASPNHYRVIQGMIKGGLAGVYFSAIIDTGLTNETIKMTREAYANVVAYIERTIVTTSCHDILGGQARQTALGIDNKPGAENEAEVHESDATQADAEGNVAEVRTVATDIGDGIMAEESILFVTADNLSAKMMIKKDKEGLELWTTLYVLDAGQNTGITRGIYAVEKGFTPAPHMVNDIAIASARFHADEYEFQGITTTGTSHAS